MYYYKMQTKISISKLIQDCYEEKKKNIFNKDVWQGKMPENQSTHLQKQKETSCISMQPSLPQYLCKMLPCTVYPQSTPHCTKSRSVQNLHAHPFSSIGIVVFETEGMKRYCTGTVIYDNLIITSALCCYNFQTQSKTSNISFIIGCWECGVNSIKSYKVKKAYYQKQFQMLNLMQNSQDSQQSYKARLQYQVALLQIEKPVAIQIGFLGINFSSILNPEAVRTHTEENKNNEQISQNIPIMKNNDKIVVVGYVRSQNSFQIRKSCIQNIRTHENLYQYQALCHYGFTGAPILSLNEQTQNYYIIGIHLGRQLLKFDRQEFKIQEKYLQVGYSLSNSTKQLFNQWIDKRLGIFNIMGKNKKNKERKQQHLLNLNEICQLTKHQLPHLIGISLNNQFMGQTGVKMLMSNKWKNLTWLQLSNNELGTASMKFLKNCDWPYLSRLSLLINNVNNEGLANLCKSNWPRLSVLSLAGNKTGAHTIETINNSNWQQLSILTLSNNEIHEIGFLFFPVLCLNMKKLSWVQHYGNKVEMVKQEIKESIKKIYFYG